MNENHKRSFLKAITWRVLATITTMVLVFVFTKQWELSLGIGVLDIIIKLLLYYSHERIWNKVKWGRK